MARMKARVLGIRLSPLELRLITQAAQASGERRPSVWARSTLLDVARRILTPQADIVDTEHAR